MARTERKPNPRKIARNEANLQRHQDNLATLAERGIQTRTGTVSKLQKKANGDYVRDGKGDLKLFTKGFEVRPSALIRTADREKANLKAEWDKVSKLSGLTPATDFSTAQHKAEIARRRN
jgi:hypothetical protein